MLGDMSNLWRKETVKTDLPCTESDLQPSQNCALIHTARFTDFQSFEQPATRHPQPLLTWLPQTLWAGL